MRPSGHSRSGPRESRATCLYRIAERASDRCAAPTACQTRCNAGRRGRRRWTAVPRRQSPAVRPARRASLRSAARPVLRFDLAGMGDSGGEFAGFERSARGHPRGDRCAPANGYACARRVSLGSVRRRVVGAHVCGRIHGSHTWCCSIPGCAPARARRRRILDGYYGRKVRSRGFWRRMAGDPVAMYRAAAGLIGNLRRARQVPWRERRRRRRRRSLPQPDAGGCDPLQRAHARAAERQRHGRHRVRAASSSDPMTGEARFNRRAS